MILVGNPLIESYLGADLFGKGIFLILLLLSGVTWVLFLQKWRFQRAIKRQAPALFERLRQAKQNPLALKLPSVSLFSPLFEAAHQNTSALFKKNHYFSQNKEEGPALFAADIDLLKGHLATAVSAQAKKLEKYLFVLSTIVSLAPFLGLLGTVWGILLTFNELQGGALTNASEHVLSGLSMALGTTVLGLVVAIFALVGYNALKNSSRQLVADMQDFSHLLLASIEMQYRRGGEK